MSVLPTALEVAVTVNERGIMMEKCWSLNLRVSSMTRLCRLLSKLPLIYSLLRRNFSLSYPFDWHYEKTDHHYHSGLPLYLNSP